MHSLIFMGQGTALVAPWEICWVGKLWPGTIIGRHKRGTGGKTQLWGVPIRRFWFWGRRKAAWHDRRPFHLQDRPLLPFETFGDVVDSSVWSLETVKLILLHEGIPSCTSNTSPSISPENRLFSFHLATAQPNARRSGCPASNTANGVGNGFQVDWTNGSHGKRHQIDTVEYYSVESTLKSLCLHRITACVEILWNIHGQRYSTVRQARLKRRNKLGGPQRTVGPWDGHIRDPRGSSASCFLWQEVPPGGWTMVRAASAAAKESAKVHFLKC